MRNLLNILFFLLLSTQFLFSQETKFTASVSQSTVATGQQFVIQFSLNANGGNFRAPNLSDFQVLSGPNQSTSMSFINGSMSAEQSFSFYLIAPKEGTYTIQSATIQYNGKIFKSNPIKMTVVKGETVPQQNNGGQSQGRNQQQADVNSSEYNGKDIFLKVDVNKSKVYKGEPLVATYRLYTRVNIVDNDMEKTPDLTGFWSKDLLNLTGNVQWQTTTVNGERYNVAVLKKVMLFPLHSGKLKIDPWKMDVVIRKQVRGNANSFFDQFFGSYQNQKISLSSNTLSIEAMPLPENGKPKSFDGMVGKYKMDVKVDNPKVRANEAINITVKINGTGNLKLIDNPKLDFPEDFEVYDPDINDNFTVVDGNLSGVREFKYLLIPRNPGKYEIDPIHFSYFDPVTKSYHELNGDKMLLDIGKGDPNAKAQSYNLPDQKDVNDLGTDIKYIKTSSHLTNIDLNYWNSSPFFGWLSLPFLLFIVAFVYKKKQDLDESDLGKMQNKKANKLVNKYLAKAKASLKSNDKNLFYQSILSAFDNYLSNKLAMNNSQMTKENIRENLNVRDVSPQVIQELEDIKEKCEIAQYAPMISDSNEVILQQAASIIQKLEKEIRNA